MMCGSPRPWFSGLSQPQAHPPVSFMGFTTERHFLLVAFSFLFYVACGSLTDALHDATECSDHEFLQHETDASSSSVDTLSRCTLYCTRMCIKRDMSFSAETSRELVFDATFSTEIDLCRARIGIVTNRAPSSTICRQLLAPMLLHFATPVNFARERNPTLRVQRLAASHLDIGPLVKKKRCDFHVIISCGSMERDRMVPAESEESSCKEGSRRQPLLRLFLPASSLKTPRKSQLIPEPTVPYN